MIQKIKTTLDIVPLQNINQTLKSMATYAWIASGTLFVCYLYFVGALTFSVVKQQSLQQNIKGLISSMSQEELTYLNIQKNLTKNYASSLGLVPSTTVSFATSKGDFAWNVGR